VEDDISSCVVVITC